MPACRRHISVCSDPDAFQLQAAERRPALSRLPGRRSPRSCCFASAARLLCILGDGKPPPQKKEVSIERQYDWSNFLFRLCPRAFLLPVSIPSLPPGAPPRASVRPVYAPGAILIWSVELGPWTRSTDGQRSDLTTPHSFHHFILSGGGRWRRPDATKFLLLSLLPAPLLARVIPLCRLPKAEQPRKEKGVGEEKRVGFSSSSGFILRNK